MTKCHSDLSGFDKFYHEQIVPDLEVLEHQRRRRAMVIFWFAAFIILLVILLTILELNFPPDRRVGRREVGIFGLIAVLGGIILHTCLRALRGEYTEKHKHLLLGAICRYLGWELKPETSQYILREIADVPILPDTEERKADDEIGGRKGALKFSVFDISLRRKQVNPRRSQIRKEKANSPIESVFRGLVIKAKMPNAYPGRAGLGIHTKIGFWRLKHWDELEELRYPRQNYKMSGFYPFTSAGQEFFNRQEYVELKDILSLYNETVLPIKKRQPSGGTHSALLPDYSDNEDGATEILSARDQISAPHLIVERDIFFVVLPLMSNPLEADQFNADVRNPDLAKEVLEEFEVILRFLDLIERFSNRLGTSHINSKSD